MSWQQPGTTVRYGGANHALHAVLTALSCGMWAPVWIIAALVQRPQTVAMHHPAVAPVFPHGTLSVSGTHYWDALSGCWRELMTTPPAPGPILEPEPDPYPQPRKELT